MRLLTQLTIAFTVLATFTAITLGYAAIWTANPELQARLQTSTGVTAIIAVLGFGVSASLVVEGCLKAKEG